jgi:hypothetical protein
VRPNRVGNSARQWQQYFAIASGTGSPPSDQTRRKKAKLDLPYPSNFLKGSSHIVFRKTNLSQTLNIAKFCTTFFQENNCFRKTEAALEQSGLMDDVRSRLHTAVGHFVFCGHDEQRNGCGIEHFGEARYVYHSRYRHTVEFVPWESKAILDEILQFTPYSRSAVSNEDIRSDPASGCLPETFAFQVRRHLGADVSRSLADAERMTDGSNFRQHIDMRRNLCPLTHCDHVPGHNLTLRRPDLRHCTLGHRFNIVQISL